MGKPRRGHAPDRNRDGRCGLRQSHSRTSPAIAWPPFSSTQPPPLGRDGIAQRMWRTNGWRSARAKSMSIFRADRAARSYELGCSSVGHRAQHEHGGQAGRAGKGEGMSKDRAVPHQFRRRAARKRLRRASRRAGAADRHPDPDRDGRDRPRDRLRPPAGRARLQRVRRRPVRQGIPRRTARRYASAR